MWTQTQTQTQTRTQAHKHNPMKQPLPTDQHHHYFHHHHRRQRLLLPGTRARKKDFLSPRTSLALSLNPQSFHGNYDKDCQKSRQNMLNKIKHNFMPESNKHINTVVAAQSSWSSTSSINRDPNEPPTKHPSHPTTHWNHLRTPHPKIVCPPQTLYKSLQATHTNANELRSLALSLSLSLSLSLFHFGSCCLFRAA